MSPPAGTATSMVWTFAQVSAPRQHAGLSEPGVVALLGAGLEDPLVFHCRVADGDALGDRPPQRLFAVQVLAGSERLGGDDPVPVVGNRDDQGVDVLAVNHPAEV